jgi:hypothetical protein
MRALDHSSISDISFGVLLLFCLLPSSGKACARPNRRHKTDKWSEAKDDFTHERDFLVYWCRGQPSRSFIIAVPN